MLGNVELSDSDKEVLSRADYAQITRELLSEETRNGVWGWVDDDLAFVSPWGFDPAEIAVPTQVCYGTQDVLVPARHGEWFADTVPGAVVRLNELGQPGRSGR